MTPTDKLRELREEWKAELSSPHSTVGLLLNSELGFPKKGETSGSMKERLIPHIVDFLHSSIQQERTRLMALIPTGKVEEHICGFNDGKQSCDCYHAALREVRELLGNETVQ